MTTATAPPIIDIAAVADKFAGIRVYQRDVIGLVGRDTELYVAEVALIAKQHIILHGSHGTAKTMTIDGLMDHLPDLSKFKTQAYKASPPEQFLGQISFKGMEQDKFIRLVQGKLPGVKVAIVDELPRGPRAVLPALQGMMVEREFDSGNGAQPVPLNTLIGTSNHLPEDPELAAFLDRFALKLIVKPPQSQDEFVTIMEKAAALEASGRPQIPSDLIISEAELEAFQEARTQVRIPRELYIKLGEVWANLLAEGITPSIRRFRDALRTMQTVALLDGRDECLIDDLQVVQHVLWTHEEEQPTVYREVVKHASAWVKETAKLHDNFQEILDRLGQVQNMVAAGMSGTATVEIKDSAGDLMKDSQGQPLKLNDHALELMEATKQFNALVQKHQDNAQGRDTTDLEAMVSQSNGARDWISDRMLGGLAL